MRNNVYRKLLFLVQYVAGIVAGHFLIGTLLTSNDQNESPKGDGMAIADSPESGVAPTTFAAHSNPALLMVGVMTTAKFLSTRACAVYQTWAQHIQGKVVFYAETTADLTGLTCSLPIVRLHGVANSYPPQKKSFMMLRHMHKEFRQSFRWFMRADDDVYINWNTIHSLLRAIQSQNVSHYIGQAGTGTIEEHGRLGLGRDQNFCMGGPGVILSAEALRQLRPHIKTCLKNLHSNHEDVEVGRCVHKHVGLSCSWAYEMMSLFFHSPTKKVPANKFSLISKAVSLHPVKESSDMYGLHVKILSFKRKQVQTRIVGLMSEIERIEMGSRNESGNPLETGIWDAIVRRNFYSVDSPVTQTKYPSHLSEGLSTAINHVMADFNSLSRERGRFIEFRDLNYGYTTLLPSRGAVHILDLLLLYKQFQKRMNQKVRRHIHLEQRFVKPRTRLLDSSNLEHVKRVNVILPLYGREEQFDRFLRHYENTFLADARTPDERRRNVRLIVVLFASPETPEIRETVRLKLSSMAADYPGADAIQVPAQGQFSRALALDIGTRMCANNDLMLFTDVDILFTSQALTTIRLTTVENHSVYFPIVFSLFQTETEDHFDDGNVGYWRHFGYGVVALHKSDYIGMNLGIRGWGKEDVDLFDRFLARQDLAIFRACDPDFVHVYHPVTCDATLSKDQLEMCLSSKANNLYSTVEAARRVLQSNILDKL